MSESNFRQKLARVGVILSSAGVVVAAQNVRANAQTVNLSLYSTGENSVWSSAVQTPYATGSTDTQWSIVSTPYGGTTSALVVNPNPAWVANSSTSQWISDIPAANTAQESSPPGAYDYQTSFIIPTNVSLSSVVIQFQLAVDDSLTSVLFDSAPTGISGGTYSAMSPTQTINSSNAAFQYGTNTIDFVTSNNGGAQGLKVSFTDATGASSAPEPSSLLLLMGIALPVGGVAGGLRKRRARKS